MYKTIFDLGSTNPIDWVELIPALLAIVFLTVGLIITRGKARSNGLPWWVLLAFFVLWTLIAGLLPYASYQRNLGLYRSGQYHVAEGPVELFQTSRDGKDESFIVGSSVFDYSCYEALGRFHRANACGGAIRPGMRVRLTYVNDADIVRVEKRL
ncbi:MAG TPA: hypothetical protein VFO29_08760 [Candidatus Rubrimentiphilum sp.]|nr:hypothetical protein [Candidatus Rubrimentiphilum sp.]